MFQALQSIADQRITGSVVLCSARPKRCSSLLYVCNNAVAIPFYFVSPTLAVKRLVGQCSEHGFECSRERRLFAWMIGFALCHMHRKEKGMPVEKRSAGYFFEASCLRILLNVSGVIPMYDATRCC